MFPKQICLHQKMFLCLATDLMVLRWSLPQVHSHLSKARDVRVFIYLQTLWIRGREALLNGQTQRRVGIIDETQKRK